MRIFAPAQEARKPSLFWRILSILFLGFGNTALLHLAFLLSLVSILLINTSPQAFYEQTRQRVAAHIYDPKSLPDWETYKGKYTDEQLKSEDDAIKYVNEMLGAIKDPYTRLLTQEQTAQFQESTKGNFTGVGVKFEPKVSADGNTIQTDSKQNALPKTDKAGNPVISQVLSGSPAYKAGVKNGDALVSIDGKPVKGQSMDTIVAQIRGKAGTTVTLSLLRNQQRVDIAITRNTFAVSAVTSFLTNDGLIGYIRLDSFLDSKSVDEFIGALLKLNSAKALVFDLRSNGGGMVESAILISSLFIEEGTIVTIRHRIPGDPANPRYKEEIVRLTSSERITEVREDGQVARVDKSKRAPYLANNRPVILLIDESSASASEITAGALQDNKAVTVIGTRSYGKGIGQNYLPHLNGTTLAVTTLRYFTPSGKWLGDGNSASKHGIDPDLVVKRKGIVLNFGTDNDNQWQAAVQYLRKVLRQTKAAAPLVKTSEKLAK